MFWGEWGLSLLHPCSCGGAGDARAMGVCEWVWEDWGKDKWQLAGSFYLIFPTPAVGSLSSLFGGHQGITMLGGEVGQKEIASCSSLAALAGERQENPYPLLKGFGGLK